MSHNKTSFRLALLMSALLLQACGGGEQEEYAGIDRGGEKPDISVTGPINGFGSVIVNGVHYNTDGAAIYVRGEPADERELDVGDYVTVVGHIDDAGQGIAHEVHYQPKVTGDIAHIDPARNRITVLGQTIQLVQDTHYDSSIMPRNIQGLHLDQRVSVSGIAGSDKVIRASRIERESSVEAEVVGMVTALDDVEQVFYLNELRVEYALANAQLALFEGQPVVVRGAIRGQVFSAHSISFAADYRRLNGIASLEIRGYVASLDGERFQIEGIPAQLLPSAVYNNGTAMDMRNDQQVRVRGHFDEDNVLQVEHLRYVSTPVMQSYGVVEAIVHGNERAGYLGVITVAGINYRLRADTSLVGDSEQRIGFGDLRIGDSVYMSAFGEQEQLVAASIAVDNRDTYTMSVQFEGAPYQIDAEAHQFLIFNRLIKTTEQTEFGEMAATLSQAEFYQTVPGKSVRVRGYLENGVLIATHAQVSENHFLYGYNLDNADWHCWGYHDCDSFAWPHTH